MRTEPFVIDVTVTGFICAPPDAQILHFLRGPVSLLGGPGPTRGTGNSNTALPPMKKRRTGNMTSPHLTITLT